MSKNSLFPQKQCKSCRGYTSRPGFAAKCRIVSCNLNERDRIEFGIDCPCFTPAAKKLFLLNPAKCPPSFAPSAIQLFAHIDERSICPITEQPCNLFRLEPAPTCLVNPQRTPERDFKAKEDGLSVTVETYGNRQIEFIEICPLTQPKQKKKKPSRRKR